MELIHYSRRILLLLQFVTYALLSQIYQHIYIIYRIFKTLDILSTKDKLFDFDSIRSRYPPYSDKKMSLIQVLMKKRQGISLPYATQLLSFALGLGAMWAFLQLRVSRPYYAIIIITTLKLVHPEFQFNFQLFNFC